MEKFFRLKENRTNVRTEIIAGVTTFFTMAYIIFVNPSILGATGMNTTAVMLATCISAAIGTLLMGLLSNYPFAQAPGMGLNAFFTYTVCFTMGYTWQQALTAVFISGILFVLLTVTGFRKALMNAIPKSLKFAISAGIGFFVAYVGLVNTGVVNFAAGVPALGSFTNMSVVLTFIGLAITAILMLLKVKGALFIGIIVTTLIGIPMGVTNLPASGDFTYNFGALKETVLAFDFAGLFNSKGILLCITVIISFTLIDMMDTIGTLVGTAAKAGMLDKDGNLPRADRAMMADAIATMAGACLGTSTVTTYVESTAGVSEGGRTGLTSVVTAILFVLAIFLSPLANMIPYAATAPALVIVGVLMIGSVTQINFSDFGEALPAFMTIAVMPLAYSISDGIAAGFIFYVIVKLVQGKAKEVHPMMYVMALLFILRFVLLAINTAGVA